jgi:threonine synthase
VRESGGFFVTVADEEILRAIPELGSSGLFVEPAAAAAWAGLRRALQDGLQDPAAPVLVLCTGSGLKDVRAVSAAVAPAPVIAPTISALEAAIHE